MKLIITHKSPDWDAITSVWLLVRFYQGWEDAKIDFVPAGGRLMPLVGRDVIEKRNSDEIIHVDTGLGLLDHHQTDDKNVCGASLTWDFVQTSKQDRGEHWEVKKEAISRMVKLIVDLDHFREVFWPDAGSDYHEFHLFGLLEGLKLMKPDEDMTYMNSGLEWLDMQLHNFENRIWAEKEIKDHGQEFATQYGKGLAVETVNGSVLKLAQKMGYMVVVRKEPRHGNVQIKARPQQDKEKQIDLTLAYEKLSKMDPKATWFLHVSKKMLLNGSSKNPTMVPTALTLDQVINVVKEL